MDKEDKQEQLNKNVEKLINSIQKQTSFKRNFLMSIVQGVGNVIGATIVAGILLFLLGKFIRSVEQIPVIGDLVKDSNIETTIDPSPDE